MQHRNIAKKKTLYSLWENVQVRIQAALIGVSEQHSIYKVLFHSSIDIHDPWAMWGCVYVDVGVMLYILRLSYSPLTCCTEEKPLSLHLESGVSWSGLRPDPTRPDHETPDSKCRLHAPESRVRDSGNLCKVFYFGLFLLTCRMICPLTTSVLW